MKAIITAVGLCLVFVFVWERVDVVRLGYQVERLKAQKIFLERERDQLQVKFSALSAPERIAKIASEKLGLTPAQQGQVFMVHLQPEGRTPAQPATDQVRIARHMRE
ncbi:MAG TPA: cell division protein FtsL [Nitrospira sp.]|nr:cell division protein FtsL [Nitrospira sp.]